jgi:glycosyltransferase involved in cell wall biosynthesis
MDSLVRWAHWPPRTDNPYYTLFYAALQPHGVEALPMEELTLSWLQSRSIGVVHVHWPDDLWRRTGKDRVQRVRGVWQLRRQLNAVRQAGMKVVWTVHNVGAHEGGDWIDVQGYGVLARAADMLICHSRSAADLVRRRFEPRGEIVVMPLGNFEGVFPRPRPRETVLRELGLDPDRPVVSCLGLLRGYKGLEVACAAARYIDGVQLIIGGPPHRKYDVAPLRDTLARVPGAVLLDRRLTDQEFADVTASSDATLLPYTRVTTSSALLASWSLGVGAVASDLPFFRELAADAGHAVALFAAGDAEALARAVVEYLAVPAPVRTEAAHEEARKFAWSRCVTPVARWIEQQRFCELTPEIRVPAPRKSSR